jgi:serine/threonine protein kinase/Flp pilus assembly protein TadD
MGGVTAPSDPLVGRIALERGLVSTEQLAECLSEQRTTEGASLGAILVRRGLLKEEDLAPLLQEQERRLSEALDVSDPRLEDALFARLLILQGLVPEAQVYECLRAQTDLAERDERVPRLGDLLVRRGYVSVDLADAALLLRRKKLLVCPSCGACFSAAGTETSRRYSCKECGCALERHEQVMAAGETAAAPRLDVPDDAAEASQDPARRFADGKYLLIQEVGRGGMGVVWKAWQTDLRRYVALKLLVGTMWTDVELKRFYREAQMAASLSHANIASIYEVGSHEGKHFIAMEFVDGESLAQLMAPPAKQATTRTVRHLQPRRSIEVVRDAALAVDYAHSKRIIHRDLKPHNIMVQRSDGRTYVMDFGLAKPIKTRDSITVSDAIVGTPQYMSPEQGRGDPLDRRADVYSLGAVLYHVLTGRPPFEARSPAETLMAVLADDPFPPRRINPRLHEDVETICLKALEKHPHRRYDSARSFAEDLTRYLEGEPISARPLSPPEKIWKAVRKRPVAFALTAATAVMALLMVSGMGILRLRTASRADSLYDQAQALFEREQFEEAQSKCQQVLTLDPAHDNAIFLLNECARKVERRAREREREEKAREGAVLRIRNTADSLFEAGLFDKALSQYAEILRLDPNDPQAEERKAICDREMVKLSAIRVEQDKLARETEGAYLELRRTEELRQKKRAKATPHYDRARRADNDAARMRVEEGSDYTIQEVLEKYRDAREALTRALREDDSYTEAWCFRGEVRHKMGDFALAERDYQEALRLSKDFGPAAFGSAMTQISLYMMHSHTPYFRDLRSRDAAFVRLAAAAQQAWQSPDAFEHACGTALQHFLKDRHSQGADAMISVRVEGHGNFFHHLVLASIYVEDKKPDEALKELASALDLNPIALEALFLRAAVRAKQGNPAGALADALKAAEAAPPENWMVHLLAAHVRESLGEKEEALRSLERAAAAPGSPAAEIRKRIDALKQ